MAFAVIQLQNWLIGVFCDRDERGASLVEYALLIALIATVCLIAVNTIGGPTSQGLSNAGSGVSN